MKSMRVMVLAFSVFVLCLCLSGCESSEYKAAEELYNTGQYKEAVDAFKALGKYEDAEEKVDLSAYYWATQLLADGNWEEAASKAKAIVTDSPDLIKKINKLLVDCDLARAEQLVQSGDYRAAADICQKILKEQTDSSIIVAADSLRRKCLTLLEAGDAVKLLEQAQTKFEQKTWSEVILLCEQIETISPGTDIAISAKELLEEANNEIRLEIAKLTDELETAYGTEDWKTVISIAATLNETYADFLEDEALINNYSNEAKQKIQEIIAEKLPPLLEKFKTDYDEVEETTWYLPSSVPRYINDYCVSYLYIGKKENSAPWLRWRTILVDSKWLYFDELIINIDGEVHTVQCRYNNVVRDSNNRNHWEYVDVQPISVDLEIIRAIVTSEKTVIRFSNEDENKTYDYTVSQKEKDGFSQTLEAFELMKNQE